MKTFSIILLVLSLSPLLSGAGKHSLTESDSAVTRKCQAYLGVKNNYIMKDSIYTGGNFAGVNSAVVPKSHFPHDALYQMEGPAWESDMVGYRLYLDERNRTDIFGKTTSKMIIDLAGKDDLLSGNESYQKQQWWGQDIFKVGNSLGIGSVAAYINDSVVTVSQSDSIKCTIINKDSTSSVITEHFGWKPANDKINLETIYSIHPGSRLTQVNVKTNKSISNFCTGLAKHENTEVLSTETKDGWSYLALWGKQTIINDNLGIAVFYNSKNKVKLTEDQLSHIIVLNSVDNHVAYYFAACWEKETNGIRTIKDFQLYLNETVESLNNQVILESRN